MYVKAFNVVIIVWIVLLSILQEQRFLRHPLLYKLVSYHQIIYVYSESITTCMFKKKTTPVDIKYSFVYDRCLYIYLSIYFICLSICGIDKLAIGRYFRLIIIKARLSPN